VRLPWLSLSLTLSTYELGLFPAGTPAWRIGGAHAMTTTSELSVPGCNHPSVTDETPHVRINTSSGRRAFRGASTGPHRVRPVITAVRVVGLCRGVSA
jgi:hypothetical protein